MWAGISIRPWDLHHKVSFWGTAPPERPETPRYSALRQSLLVPPPAPENRAASRDHSPCHPFIHYSLKLGFTHHTRRRCPSHLPAPLSTPRQFVFTLSSDSRPQVPWSLSPSCLACHPRLPVQPTSSALPASPSVTAARCAHDAGCLGPRSANALPRVPDSTQVTMPSKTNNGVGVQVEDTKICVVMVGLPARGKSYIAQIGMSALEPSPPLPWQGINPNPLSSTGGMHMESLADFFFLVCSPAIPAMALHPVADVQRRQLSA